METGKLAAALAKAQSEFPMIPKDKVANVPTKAGGSYKYRYADLGTVLDKVMKVLAKHEISVTHPMQVRDGLLILKTVLRHSSGEMIEGEYPLPLETSRPQEMGSAITYGRRYSLCAMLSVAAEEDDDGQAAQEAGEDGADKSKRPAASTVADSSDPGDYVVPVGRSKGARLRDLDTMEISESIKYWTGIAAKEKRELTGPVAEFVSTAKLWLSRGKASA